MIETRLLRQFIAVAEELHFHKAAARLHMAQPPLSQAINRLEDKLGFGLFIRDKREVRMTPAGEAFLQTAYRTLAELEQGIEHARRVAQGIAGTLTVTAISIACYEPLLDAFRQFRETFAQARLVIREMPSCEQLQPLLSEQTDIAFMRELPLPAHALTSRRILDEQIVMAMPCDHALAQQPTVDLRHFADQAFVFTPQALGSGYHSQLMALCAAAGFYPKVVQEASKIHTLLGLVACGFGVALVPEYIARSVSNDKVRLRPIQPLEGQANPAMGLYMNWNHRHVSPLRDNFMALLGDGWPD